MDLSRSVLLNDLTVGFTARPKRAFLRLEINVVQSEPHRVTLGPLKIIQKRPVVVGTDIVAGAEGVSQHPKMAAKVLFP